jgi:glycosyltransferase involved in cell wall biosynthesis
MVDRVAAEPAIQFLGWADRSDLVDRLDRSRSLWLPSLWAEPFGIIGLEAMARGVPVIGSKIGGIPEWLEHGVTGFLVEPGDSREIAERADLLACDTRLARSMGDAARQRVRDRYDRDRTVDRLLKLLGARTQSAGV